MIQSLFIGRASRLTMCALFLAALLGAGALGGCCEDCVCDNGNGDELPQYYDLAIVGIQIGDSIPDTQTPLYVTGMLKNLGGLMPECIVWVSFGIDSGTGFELSGVFGIDSISPGEIVPVCIRYYFDEPGEYVLRIAADDHGLDAYPSIAGSIAEIDEANNTMTLNIEVHDAK